MRAWLAAAIDAGILADRLADGRLVREALARDLDVARSVFYQNRRVKALLRKVESPVGLAVIAAPEGRSGVDIIQTIADLEIDETANLAASGASVGAVDRAASAELKALRTKVAALEEENRYLRSQLAKNGLIDTILPDTGRLPW
ncbi:hypothetical protein D2T81_04030 [Azospirillum brasilense]|nr:hypothetical protein D2T81_04030 [Azospirillum brasilense]